MSFASEAVKAFPGVSVPPSSALVVTAFSAPLAAVSGTNIALNTITAGSTVSNSQLILAPLGVGGSAFNVEFESLCAIVQTKLTTSTITAQTFWQASEDASNWVTLFGLNNAANVTVAAAGTGSLVTTTYVQSAPVNPSFPYLRLAVLVGVATGAAGDNVIVAYEWRRRQIAPLA